MRSVTVSLMTTKPDSNVVGLKLVKALGKQNSSCQMGRAVAHYFVEDTIVDTRNSRGPM